VRLLEFVILLDGAMNKTSLRRIAGAADFLPLRSNEGTETPESRFGI